MCSLQSLIMVSCHDCRHKNSIILQACSPSKLIAVLLDFFGELYDVLHAEHLFIALVVKMIGPIANCDCCDAGVLTTVACGVLPLSPVGYINDLLRWEPSKIAVDCGAISGE